MRKMRICGGWMALILILPFGAMGQDEGDSSPPERLRRTFLEIYEFSNNGGRVTTSSAPPQRPGQLNLLLYNGTSGSPTPQPYFFQRLFSSFSSNDRMGNLILVNDGRDVYCPFLITSSAADQHGDTPPRGTGALLTRTYHLTYQPNLLANPRGQSEEFRRQQGAVLSGANARRSSRLVLQQIRDNCNNKFGDTQSIDLSVTRNRTQNTHSVIITQTLGNGNTRVESFTMRGPPPRPRTRPRGDGRRHIYNDDQKPSDDGESAP